MMRQRQAAVPWLSRAPLARGQQGGHELPFLGEQFWRHRRVHARIDAMQRARHADARSIAEPLMPAASSCARATIAFLLCARSRELFGIGVGFRG